MERKSLRQVFFSSPLFLLPSFFWSFAIAGGDTCTINDDCFEAIAISTIISNGGYVCIEGCNMYASPEVQINSCQMGDFPTVWYSIEFDPQATIMNVEVSTTEFESPVISIFKGGQNCTNPEPVYLNNGDLACVIGADGLAKLIGTPCYDGSVYYIAISSMFSIGGDFELCVSALSTGFMCVKDRDIEVTARSNGGPLEGPFDPGETVSICMNVHEYTAAGNGCQWFQGLVPVFGNGWDPMSFDTNGQPVNAKVNGELIGVISNGLYGATTWDWFRDVDYHYDQPTFTVMDLDNNGTIDMCNSAYETDCPHTGIQGGCCGPCWGTSLGDLLPGGWFAYGINGSCPTPGPPVRGDWGDGNTCGGGMGPWSFCFDLVTRDLPDCNVDSTRKDLSLGFFTFADGETGSWVGDASVCAYDGPVRISLKAKCGRVSRTELEELEPLCPGDTLQYLIEETGITDWEWNISPFWAAPSLTNKGTNGTLIEVPLVNGSDEPVDVRGVLIGHQTGSEDILIRQFTFRLNDTETCETVSVDPSSDLSEKGMIRLYPVPADQNVVLEWSFEMQRNAVIDIYNSQGTWQEQIEVNSTEGNRKVINTSQWPSGIYLVRLSNTDFRYVAKLVKM